jgi:prepilin-type N-terminal cleavage/methylation domain-containing protein
MTRKSGFTLIELLVVIAIIAVLAGILFPVFMRAKESAYRSGDMTNMNSIRTALQLYRADQGAYPPQLLGYVTTYMSGPNAGQVIPADQYKGPLVPRRLDSYKTLQPAYDHAKETDVTVAEWPNPDPRPTPTAPLLDLDQDGSITSADDLDNARQSYGPGNFYTSVPPYATATAGNGTQFYSVSGYETAEVKLPGNAVRRELRYTLFWTGWGVSTGSVNDDPRQLGYTDPPDTTVVTWDSWFRDYDGYGEPVHAKKDYVLFLGGGARPYDSKIIHDQSWRVMP